MPNFSRKSTSISLHTEIWKISKLLASQVDAMKGGYCQPVDIVEYSLLRTIKDFRELIPQEFQSRIDEIQLPKRLPIIK